MSTFVWKDTVLSTARWLDYVECFGEDRYITHVEINVHQRIFFVDGIAEFDVFPDEVKTDEEMKAFALLKWRMQ